MYPELHPMLEGKRRRLKGFALFPAGGSMSMATAMATDAVSSQEIASFEAQDAHAFERSLRDHVAKSKS